MSRDGINAKESSASAVVYPRTRVDAASVDGGQNDWYRVKKMPMMPTARNEAIDVFPTKRLAKSVKVRKIKERKLANRLLAERT